MTRLGMVVDKRRCAGCGRCVMACIVEHNLPDGVRWNRIVNEGGELFRTPGEDENGKLWMRFYTLACQHCQDPACVKACPTGATFKRESDGIVLVDYGVCIGCGSCIMSCPYKGVRTMVDGEPVHPLDFATGDNSLQPHQANTVSKCTFCVERTDRGEIPRCVEVCYAHARVFGDLDDPESEISKFLAEHETTQMRLEMGTGPSVYFAE